jgi:hypothetical protein
MFAAGAERHACEGGRIGVHRPSTMSADGIKQEADDPRILNSILQTAASFGVPQVIQAKLSTTPSEDITWLSNEDLTQMGVQPCQ